jgi:hypothetical protein
MHFQQFCSRILVAVTDKLVLRVAAAAKGEFFLLYKLDAWLPSIAVPSGSIIIIFD